jgi:hypothetical protein
MGTDPAFLLFDGANSKDLAQCQQQCSQTTECTGVEHYPPTDRCEVWIIPILATADVDGLNCYVVNPAPVPAPTPGLKSSGSPGLKSSGSTSWGAY